MRRRVVQQVPDVELSLRLSRPRETRETRETVDAPCPCTLTGAGWGSLIGRQSGGEAFGQEQEYSQEQIFDDEWGDPVGFPDPTTVYAIGLTVELPEGDSPHSYLGVPFGDICGVEWSWSFSWIAGPYTDETPGGWGGVAISQEGAHLHVVVQPGSFDAGEMGFYPVARVDATARCPDGSSASLWLVLGFDAFFV